MENYIRNERTSVTVKMLTSRQKKWQISHCRKILNLLTKQNKRKPTHIVRGKKLNYVRVTAPTNLSITDGLDESIQFFHEVLDVIKKCVFDAQIDFDLSKVENISIGSVMYIIALINNVKRLKAYRIVCAGNFPGNASARKVIEKSGFYQYVSSPFPRSPFIPGKQIQISRGTEADGKLVGEICEFVIQLSGKDRKCTKRLFPMIIELMTNTNQHAYGDASSIMADNWYIFAENGDTSIKFVFLDTGSGIPSTIRKKFTEKLFPKTDAEFISSALRGELRSETNKRYRGKGLPEIYNDSKAGRITDLLIISGTGKCMVKSDGSIEESTLKYPLIGTLFSWNFSK